MPYDRHRPHVPRAASAFRSERLDRFRELRDVRLAELFHWLHYARPFRLAAPLDGSCVTEAPKENLEGKVNRTLRCFCGVLSRGDRQL